MERRCASWAVRKTALGAGMVVDGGRLDPSSPRSLGDGPWFATLLKGSQSAPARFLKLPR